ncbi:MAG TPA: hypothetical protein P5154_06810 [Candidatus Izemoplasmatales bacterium]|nr:hypothetical protein [Bacillota bacterium]HRY78454.1 hypothetical protein [Candidatus Izemoplasmatales bacterium]
MKTGITVSRSLRYLLGLALLSLGVILAFKADLGVLSADNLTYIVALLMGTTLGTASFLICSGIIVFLLVVYRKWNFLFLFVQVGLFSPLMDFWDLTVLESFAPQGWVRYATFLAALFLIPLGNAVLIRTTYPAGIYDELMFFTARLTRFRLPAARLLNEIVLIGVALVLSFSTGNGWGSVRWGTFVLAVSIGPLIKGYLQGFDKITSSGRNRLWKSGN